MFKWERSLGAKHSTGMPRAAAAITARAADDTEVYPTAILPFAEILSGMNWSA
jgi:hypothetical protein